MSAPGSSSRGFSMPFAMPMSIQASPFPAAPARPCRDDPAGAWVSGRVPAWWAAAAPRAPPPASSMVAKANWIFCWEMLRVTLARRGRPSGEKNSSDSSSDSMMPSNWNVPQMKRTPGGTSLVGSSGAAWA